MLSDNDAGAIFKRLLEEPDGAGTVQPIEPLAAAELSVALEEALEAGGPVTMRLTDGERVARLAALHDGGLDAASTAALWLDLASREESESVTAGLAFLDAAASADSKAPSDLVAAAIKDARRQRSRGTEWWAGLVSTRTMRWSGALVAVALVLGVGLTKFGPTSFTPDTGSGPALRHDLAAPCRQVGATGESTSAGVSRLAAEEADLATQRAERATANARRLANRKAELEAGARTLAAAQDPGAAAAQGQAAAIAVQAAEAERAAKKARGTATLLRSQAAAQMPTVEPACSPGGYR